MRNIFIGLRTLEASYKEVNTFDMSVDGVVIISSMGKVIATKHGEIVVSNKVEVPVGTMVTKVKVATLQCEQEPSKLIRRVIEVIL